MLEGIVVRLRREESKDSGQCERHGYPQKVRTIFTPPRIGPVSYQSHNRVRHGVIELCHQNKCSGMCQTQTEDIGVEERKIIGKDFPEHR